jgi:hypothetical protein
MPWTKKDVKKHKKGLSDKQEEQWVAVANSVRLKELADGKSEDEAAASAIRQANGVVGNSEMGVYFQSAADYNVQERMHQGRKHLVVPVTMMVEGVHNGSHGPLLHTIAELGKFPESWNGIPVVIDHPEVDGQIVSANDPDIIDSRTVGRVYRTHVNGNRLKAQVWLDEVKLKSICPTILERVKSGEQLEVSVGVFSDEEKTEGDWNGEIYEAKATNHCPDHLAILPTSQGACSLADGCGIRANRLNINLNKEGMETNAQVTDMEAKRKELGMSVAEFYAVPRDPPSESKLPIFDEAHVRNAMARFNQTQGLSTEEKASAHGKIVAKARKAKIDVTNFKEMSANEELFDTIKSLNVSGFTLSEIVDNTDGAGMSELMQAAHEKLNSMDTTEAYHNLEEVYPNEMVYSKRSRGGSGNKMYKQAYAYDSKGMKLTGDPVEVQKKVSYVNCNKDIQSSLEDNNAGDAGVEEVVSFIRTKFKNKEVKMSEQKCPRCLEKINALIANTASGFVEADREWLTALNESQLDKVAPKVVEKTIEVNKLTPEQTAAIAYATKQQTEKRNELIQGIQTNTSKELWPDDVLKGMNDDHLKRIFDSVKKEAPADYSLNSGGNLNVNADAVEPMYATGVEIETVKK